MRHFIDLGTNTFQGLEEFTAKLNLGKNDNVYCYEPNITVYELSRQNNQIEHFETKFHSFTHLNLAVMNYSGKIIFNEHKGVWTNSNKDAYINDYTGGSNCLVHNPITDPVNGVYFDIQQQECNCIDIEEIISSIVLSDINAEIYIKCDIEGSEFVVLPKLLKSKYINNVKNIYIEWHERFWYGTDDHQNKINQRKDIIENFNNINIQTFEHH